MEPLPGFLYPLDNGIYISDDSREQFEAAYKATGKRLDVGKSCVRFKKLDDLPIELVGETIASVDVDELVKRTKEAHSIRKIRKRKFF